MEPVCWALKDKADYKLFVTQKHCIRILFGDLAAYLEKLSTCARTRPYSLQKLGTSFHQKEHTKLLFNELQILTVQDLFKYYCISEIFKIMKFRCPYPLYNSICISNRDTSLNIILPEKTNTFLYAASLIWNTIHKSIVKSDSGLEASVGTVKLRSKSIILNCQAVGLRDHWTDKNFQITSAHDTSSSPSSSPTSSDIDTEKFVDIMS